MCMIDNADLPEFTDTTTPKARVQHRCSECGGAIAIGDKYERATGMWDGRINRFKTCLPCVEGPRAWLEDECGGWLFKGVREDLVEHFDHHFFEPGAKMRLGRLIVGMDRRRRLAQ